MLDDRPALYSHRSNEVWTWDMLDLDDKIIDRFEGVRTGKITRNVNANIKTGGQVVWRANAQPDWTKIRLRPTYAADLTDGTHIEWQFGVFIPSTPKVKYDGASINATIDLYDKLLVVHEDAFDYTYSLPAGTNVTTAIRSILASAGEEKVSVLDSTATLVNPMVWPVGTTKLVVINELLRAINYFSLWVDNAGWYRCDPYVGPQYRGKAYQFIDGDNCYYNPEYEHDRDYYAKPNKVILISQGSGEVEAMKTVATNEDPLDPLSYQQRGRWITVTEEGIEAASQSILDDLGVRRLESLSRVSSTIELSHGLLDLNLNDVVGFANTLDALSLNCVIQEQEIPCESGAPVTSVLRKVDAEYDEVI